MTLAKGKPILQREFITIPTLLCLPLWYRRRADIWFINNHNIAAASKRFWERWALGLMNRLGFNLVSLEIITHALPPFRSHKIIPAPLSFDLLPDLRRRPADVFRVGIAGGLRSEQKPEETIGLIRSAAKTLGVEIKVVCISNNQARIDELAPLVDEVISTHTDDSYYSAIGGLDCLSINYDCLSYLDRPSGVISDAISCGVPVVAPDIDVFRSQIMNPRCMGAVFSGDDPIHFSEALRLALSLTFNERLHARNAHRELRCSKNSGGFFRSFDNPLATFLTSGPAAP